MPEYDERAALEAVIRKHLRFVEHMNPDSARSAGAMIADRFLRERAVHADGGRHG